ncbi:hypothetical protein C2G38_2272093 [Gigaspora rosea]|uniref:TLDc domain-containing protein n=1 Tax=Gigaspora rosea TaxID=44941 RepID=A0A397UD42_9GLOM|nr:hypothetical protein C2G38_2272093 [Gigaspora rosea]
MLVACEFLLEELVKYLETHLIETNSSWLRLRFSHIYKTSFQNNQLQDLQKWCNDIVAKYPDKLFESEDFTSLPENALISLIRRDDLQMEERKIWNYVIKWGIAQNPGLSSDPTSWTNENFLALKATLKNCLPFIRFFQMTNDDIVDIVNPYHQILEKNLWDDILKRFLTPNRQISSIILPPRVILTPKLPSRVTEPFSTVINEMHAAEIASWVDKKAEAYSVINNPYEFKLLLRGSRDGFTRESFWNLCDQQTNTVLIIKVNGTDEILGGYNPTFWDKSKGWISCNDSFIFSMKNGTIQSSILSRVKKPQHAIFSSSGCGPQFGSGGDLYMANNFNQINNCFCRHEGHSSYERSIRNTNGLSRFSVSEYEIFQIQKKD